MVKPAMMSSQPGWPSPKTDTYGQPPVQSHQPSPYESVSTSDRHISPMGSSAAHCASATTCTAAASPSADPASVARRLSASSPQVPPQRDSRCGFSQSLPIQPLNETDSESSRRRSGLAMSSSIWQRRCHGQRRSLPARIRSQRLPFCMNSITWDISRSRGHAQSMSAMWTEHGGPDQVAGASRPIRMDFIPSISRGGWPGGESGPEPTA
jgi:hypothetical protein